MPRGMCGDTKPDWVRNEGIRWTTKVGKISKESPGAKIINVFRAWIGAQLTIFAQKLRNFVLFSTVRLTFVLSRVLCFSL